MKKITWATHKSLFGQIATSTCLLAASAGIVFGVSAGNFKIEYFDLTDSEARLQAAISNNYYSQNIKSQWNMYEKKDAVTGEVTPGNEQPHEMLLDNSKDWWEKTYGSIPKWNEADRDVNPAGMELEKPQGESIGADSAAERKKYGTLIIDGATHTALDRSFNQSLYNGIANFISNIPHDVKGETEGLIYKPSQDSTQEFVNIYRKAAEQTRVLCLAGFNHVTPINALGKRNGSLYKFDDENIAKTGLMLIDGDISNNQNVASILFRSDQPAFLTALSTCMYFYNNLDKYHDNFQDIAVAAYGGTAIPTVSIYMGGFQRGIEFFNKFILYDYMLSGDAADYMYNNEIAEKEDDHFLNHLLPASKYKDEIEEIKALPETDPSKDSKVTDMVKKLYDEYSIKMIKLGNYGTHFSGSFAAGDAIGISKQYLNRGASAIIAVAGPQSLDTAQEIMNQNKNCIVIGVDCAMENGDYQKPFKNPAFKDNSKDAAGKQSAQAGNILKFSAVKDMTTISDKILRLAASGKNWDVTNAEPWTSQTPIPPWTEEQEFSKFNYTKDEETKTFSIDGFSDSPTEKQDVLVIPTTIEDGGTTYRLKVISKNAFTDDQLKNFTTLKLKGAVTWNIIFGDNAFGFEHESPNGFHYIDLSDIPCGRVEVEKEREDAPFGYMGHGPESKVYHKGIVKLGEANSTQEAFSTFYNLFNGSHNADWSIVEADPNRSVCSFGFKTCGNIENGMISISWDGWPLLVDCLRHLTGLGAPAPRMPGWNFFEIWDKEADEYFDFCEEKGITLSDEFKAAVITNLGKDWKKLFTYDTNSVLHKDYSHVMTILGWTLKTATIEFEKDMTIALDAEGKPSIPTGKQRLSILDWLTKNMYFIA